MREMQTGVHPDPTLAEVQGPAAVLWARLQGRHLPQAAVGWGKGSAPLLSNLALAVTVINSNTLWSTGHIWGMYPMGNENTYKVIQCSTVSKWQRTRSNSFTH